MSQIYVNIACGDSFIDGWKNFDYQPYSPLVTKANLLDQLPLSDISADVIYSSHFLEHIPRNLVEFFLAECFRVTKPGGRLRLVLPDLEEMCRTYLDCRDKGEHDKADFLVLEMIDQCVRSIPGGELGSFYKNLIPTTLNEEMVNYVRQRTGHELQSESVVAKGNRWIRNLKSFNRVFSKIERLYCGAILKLLPAAFRQQNVTTAEVGERHTWIYDYHSVEKLLKQSGFVNVSRVTSTTSNIQNFPHYPLDVNHDGNPRKGLESMYIEAVKP